MKKFIGNGRLLINEGLSLKFMEVKIRNQTARIVATLLDMPRRV